MAKAELETKKIARPIEYDEVEVVTLELTIQEAMFLSAITSRIGGSSATSMRGISDSIRDALEPYVGRREFKESAWLNNGVNEVRKSGFAFGSETNPEDHTFESQFHTVKW